MRDDPDGVSGAARRRAAALATWPIQAAAAVKRQHRALFIPHPISSAS
jgi:hypothetical protein